jgi:hypothetical protein
MQVKFLLESNWGILYKKYVQKIIFVFFNDRPH